MANTVEIIIKGIDQTTRVFDNILKHANRAFGQVETAIRNVPDIDIDTHIDSKIANKQIDQIENNIKNLPDVDVDSKANTKAAMQAIDNLEKNIKDVPDVKVDANVDGAVKEMDKVKEKMEDVEDQAEESSNRISEAFKKAAGVVAGFFAIDKLKDFSISAIEAAASAQAMQAQFEQVFGNMQRQAQGVVNDLGKSFGMVPNRIKPAFTQMTSMFKGLGLDTNEAMKQAEIAVTLVADAAAFYDKSFEEANEALNSFIKGNYEGGESIGLFASETQMAAWAAKNLKVDWDNLSEAEKQVIRLKYAQAMQKAAGATGQAARESNSYANQLGNLKQIWQDFQAQFAAPFLSNVISGLITLGQLVKSINVKPLQQGLMTLGGYVKDIFVPVFNDLKSLFQTLVVDTGGIEAAKGAFAGFKGILEWMRNNTPVVTATLLGLVSAFTAFKVINAVNTAIGKYKTLMGVLRNNTLKAALAQMGFNTALLTSPITWVAVGIGALIAAVVLLWKNWDTVSNFLINTWNGIKESASTVFQTIGSIISGVWEQIVNVVQTVWGWISSYLSAVWYVIQTIALAVWNVIFTTISSIWNGLLALATPIFQGIANIVSTVWQGIQTVALTVWNYISSFLSTVWNGIKTVAIAVFTPLIAILAGIWTTIQTVTLTVWNAIKSVLSTLWNGIKSVAQTVFSTIAKILSSIWNAIKGVAVAVWNGIKNTLVAIWEGIKALAYGRFNSIKDLIATIWNILKNVTSAVWNSIKNAVMAIWNGMKGIASSIFNGVKNVISSIWKAIRSVTLSVWNGIRSVLSGSWSSIRGLASSAFNTIRNVIVGAWNRIRSATSSIWDGITGAIRGAVNGVIRAINGMIGALNRVKIKLPKIPDWVPGIGGKGGGTIGFNIPKIPYLASGGVVNKPTLAVVGDAGRSNPEIVAPQKMISGIIAEEMKNLLAEMKSLMREKLEITVYSVIDGKIAGKTLAPYIDRELGDRRIIRARSKGYGGGSL